MSTSEVTVHPRCRHSISSADEICPPPSQLLSLNIESLKPFFHLTLDEAAYSLGLGSTTLKQVCRSLGISRWPYRQVTAKFERKHGQKRKKSERNSDPLHPQTDSVKGPKKSRTKTHGSPQACAISESSSCDSSVDEFDYVQKDIAACPTPEITVPLPVDDEREDAESDAPFEPPDVMGQCPHIACEDPFEEDWHYW